MPRVASIAADTPRLAVRLREAATPARVHLLVLVLGGAVGLLAATRLGLFYDDWAFLVPSLDDPWAPHVGHWSTLPFLIFRGIQGVFGVDSFVPFAVPVLLAHLAVVHLLWRLMLRVGVPAWLATALSVVVTFLGAGSENILWAFQIGFVGALAFMLAVILLATRPRLTPPVVAAMVGLSLLALMSSGTALPMLAIAALITWLRHGFWRSAALFAAPVAGYLVWYLLRGRFAPSAGRAEGLGDLLGVVPTYALTMLSDGFGRAFPVAVLGTLLFAATAIGGIVTWSTASRDTRTASLLFLAAPVFALLTGFSRAGLGLETAVSSRYLYFVIVAMLPLMALGLNAVMTRTGVPRAGVIALILLWALYNAGGLALSLADRAAASAQTRERLSAAAVLLERGDELDPGAQPDVQWAPDVTVADLETLIERGWFTADPVGERAELSALALLALEAEASATGPATCTTLEPGEATTGSGARVVVHSPEGTTVTIAVARGEAVGDARPLYVPGGWTAVSVRTDEPVDLRVTAPEQQIDVCRGD